MKKMCSHTPKTSSEEVIMMHSEKTKAKIHEKGCVKRFFRKLAGWHLTISLQINFIHR